MTGEHLSVAELAAAGEAFCEELGRESYLTGAGLKAEPAFEAVYRRHERLLGPAAFETARASGDAALLEWLVDLRVGRAIAALEEEQIRWERGAVVTVGGRAVPYLRVPIELANSADRQWRTALDAARGALAARELAPLRAERFRREHAVIAELGLGDYVGAISRLSGIDLPALGTEARGFLERTKDLYFDALERLVARRLRVSLDELVRADAAWLFRASAYDAAFAGSDLVPTALRQMAELGIDATKGGRVRLDVEEREGKQPRAFCAPVRVPEEIYLVLRPSGGYSDYRTLWHELGHALHFASMDAGLAFSARWLGDNSVTEGFAMLWDHMTLAPEWLRRYPRVGRPDVAELVFELEVGELYLLRRYAAKVLYELELHRGEFDRTGALYAELLSDATGFRYPEGDALLDVDSAFYAARYLRAWQLEALLAAHLVERFDEDWFRNPRAGREVEDWMAAGQSEPADRLAVRLTGRRLSFGAVAERFERVLQ